MTYVAVIVLVVRLVEILIGVETSVPLTNIEYICSVSEEGNIVEHITVFLVLGNTRELVLGVVGIVKNDLKRVFLLGRLRNITAVIRIVKLLVGKEFAVADADEENVCAVAEET